MIIHQGNIYECTVCGSTYTTEGRARLCEARPEPLISGLKKGDYVKFKDSVAGESDKDRRYCAIRILMVDVSSGTHGTMHTPHSEECAVIYDSPDSLVASRKFKPLVVETDKLTLYGGAL